MALFFCPDSDLPGQTTADVLLGLCKSILGDIRRIRHRSVLTTPVRCRLRARRPVPDSGPNPWAGDGWRDRCRGVLQSVQSSLPISENNYIGVDWRLKRFLWPIGAYSRIYLKWIKSKLGSPAKNDTQRRIT